MKLTPEQEAVVNSNCENGRITAFAGTGKTSTLVKYAEANPKQNFLYVAFNRAVKQEAEIKFPKNTHCRTLHSLAYKETGRQFYKKLDIAKPATIVGSWCNDSVFDAYAAIKTVTSFTYSSEKEISAKDVPIPIKKQTPHEVPRIIRLANFLWSKMKDPKEKQFPISHDGYLKIAYDNGSLVDSLARFDHILFDEAQDANGIMSAALKEADRNIMAVGDSHQGIYQWRGAVDILENFGGENFSLTNSFWFGDNLAAKATALLARFKDETKVIRGLDGETKILDEGQEELKEKHTTICRTNSGMLLNAILLLNGNSKLKYHFLGGLNKKTLGVVMSVYGVMFNRSELVRSPEIIFICRGETGGKGVKLLNDYLEKVEDPEICMSLKLCEKFGVKTLGLLYWVQQENTEKEENADRILVTAHRAKGLEFDNVVLENDFFTFEEVDRPMGFPLVETGPQEVNLLYVAMTRAKNSLYTNKMIQLWDEIEKTQGNLSFVSDTNDYFILKENLIAA